MSNDVRQPTGPGNLRVTHVSDTPVDSLKPRAHLKLKVHPEPLVAGRISITEFSEKPVTADGTVSNAGVRVTVTLSGCGMDQMKEATIDQTTGTTWHVDFGYVPEGTYTLTATGSDGSSASVEIVVGSGKCAN